MSGLVQRAASWCLCTAIAIVMMASFAEASGGLGETVADGAEAASGGTRLVQSRNVHGDYAGTLQQLAGQSVTVATSVVKCPKDNCRIEAIMSVQVATGIDDNKYAICFVVDDLLDDTGCPFLGNLSSGEDLHGTTTSGVKTGLNKGRHKVKVRFYSLGGALIGRYNATFSAYSK